MKIAVTSAGTDMSSELDQRFGRAAYFVFVDPETMEFEAVENAQNLDLPQGAGIQAGKTIVENKAEVLITGNCGPNAFKVLNSAGIKVFTNAKGKVEDAVSQYIKGELDLAAAPNVEGHWV
jgi:predicted Fe-Mo cluster-binding NifX family protein